MVKISRVMKVVMLCLVMGLLIAGTSAMAEEIYTVSPEQIDMGTFVGPPPNGIHVHTISIAVIAGPDNDPDADAAFSPRRMCRGSPCLSPPARYRQP